MSAATASRRTMSSASSTTSSSSQRHQQQEIVEHRKKNKETGEYTVRRYLKGRLLGKGGFAKCYKFTCLEDNRVYAGKVVEKASLKKSRAKQKFESYFEDSKNVYIILEVCHNQVSLNPLLRERFHIELPQTLMELLRRRRRLTEPETQYYMYQIIEGLKFLHEKHIIHRDLKLGNLFLTKDMEIRIGDLGLATQLTHAEERKKTICGTPNYIAPEILEGSKSGHSFEVDIWSIGVILYTMLVGKPPFETNDVKATYKRIKANHYTFPVDKPISDNARDLIQRILTRTPSRRPTLREIVHHPFFTHRNSYVPMRLPVSSLTAPPRLTAEDVMPGQAAAERLWSSSIPEVGAVAGGGDSAPRPDHAHPYSENEPIPGTVHPASTKPYSGSGRSIDPSSGGARTRHPLGVRSTNRRSVSPRARPITRGSTTRSSSQRPSTATHTTEAGRPGRPTSAMHAPSVRTASSSAASRRPTSARSDTHTGHGTGHGTGDASSGLAAGTRRRGTSPRVAGSGHALPPSSAAARDDASDHVESPRLVQIVRPSTAGGEIRSATVTVTAASARSASRAPSAAAAAATPDARDGADNNGEAKVDTLKRLHDRLASSVCGIAPSDLDGALAEAADPAPSEAAEHEAWVWVSSWVDFTTKYGLGYLLADGTVGVYFNDSTKIALATDGNSVEYVERAKPNEDGVRVEPPRQFMTLDCFPDEMKKKVTLLKHFRNYLRQQDEKRDMCPEEKAMRVHGSASQEMVYLKKWVRTRHALLFRLSSRTVQVSFFDKSTVILSSEAQRVTYEDKHGERQSFRLSNVAALGRPDIAKRLKYTKDILYQLISGRKKDAASATAAAGGGDGDRADAEYDDAGR